MWLESDEQEGSPAGAWSGKLRLEGRETAATEDLASNTEKGPVRSRESRSRVVGERTLKQLGPSRFRLRLRSVVRSAKHSHHFRLVQRCCRWLRPRGPGWRTEASCLPAPQEMPHSHRWFFFLPKPSRA